MSTTIAGHRLTDRQAVVLDSILGYLRDYSCDSEMSARSRPKCDGRWVPLTEIFSARNNIGNGSRRVARRLGALGILAACEVRYYEGCVRPEPGLPRGEPEPAASPEREAGEGER